MTNQVQVLNLLGLAKRAGRLITGEELVVKAVQNPNNKPQLIFLASDAASNLTKKISDKSHTYQIKISQDFTQNELSKAIGSDRKVIAVADKGFAKKMEKLLMQ